MIRIVVLVGPSASGKSTVRDKFNFSKIVTYTTRSPRSGEISGVHYHFTDRESLMKLKEDGRLLEYTEYSGNLYATSIDSFDNILRGNDIYSVVLDADGARKIKELYGDSAIIIGVTAGRDECIARMQSRSGEDNEHRIASFEKELQETCDISEIIINNSKKYWETSARIISIIKEGILSHSVTQSEKLMFENSGR